jgi:hypothetical protein
MRHTNARRTGGVPSAVVAALLLAVAGADGAGAQEAPVSLQELAQRADVVMVGDCTQVRSFWNPSHTMIFTEVIHRAAAPELVFKGALVADHYRFIQPGGRVDNLRTLVPHQAAFELDQRSLLFLYEQSRIRLYGTVDGYVGRIPVRVDPRYEQEYVELWQDPNGRLYSGAAGRQMEQVRLTLSELAERMKSVVELDPEVK